ncbi:DUF2188 domain-containing protein (plasmid) [Cupriavidus basilensis]
MTNETRSVRMPVTTVRVMLTEKAHWAVERDDGRERFTYPSKGAAIAAGVHIAMAEDALLTIDGVNEEPKCPRFQRLRRSVGHLTALAFVQRAKPAVS